MPTLRRSIGTAVMSLPSNSTLPPVSGTFEPGDDAQHGGFAAAGGAEQHQRFTTGDVKRCRFERTRPVGKGLAAGLDTHRGAVSGLRTHLFCSFSANNCMATSSGMIITKKISV